jgi:hypothetical protein
MNREYPNEAIICFYYNSGTYHYLIEKILQGEKRDFTDLFYDLGITPLFPLRNECPYRIRIVIHSWDSIHTYNAQRREDVNNFAQSQLENEKGGQDVKKWHAIPCIHVSEEDSIAKSVYGSEPLNEKVPRSFQILDNSIWNYFVPQCEIPNFDDTGRKTKLTYKDCFSEALKSIIRNYEKHLYNLSVAKEYADLNARLAKEAFVAGSHAEGVSPFIFHSESVIQRMIKKEFIGEDNALKRITNRKWRILLVDDKAIKGMESDINNTAPEFQWNCKLFIIVNLLNSFLQKYTTSEENISKKCRVICKDCRKDRKEKFRKVDNSRKELVEIEKKDVNHDIIVLFEYAQSIKEAEKALTDKTYDLILLDYYMEKDEDSKHSYGTDLLETIYTYVSSKHQANDIRNIKNSKELISEEEKIFDPQDQDVKYEELRKYIKKREHNDLCKIFNSKDIKVLLENVETKLETEKGLGNGPGGRQFFMFISAYSSAVHDRLLAEGLNQSEKYWYINLGACPTNTPQLFLYNLLKLMDKRLDDSGILKLSSIEIYSLINRIFLQKKEDPKGDSIRKRANALYQKVLSLQYHYRSILKNVEIPFGQNANVFDTKGSVLMTDFIQNRINLGGMLEHLTQLVHLTAFGTIRQWPEMWEEYIYFKAMFEKQLDEVSSKNFNILCQNIENYILELKSQQQ